MTQAEFFTNQTESKPAEPKPSVDMDQIFKDGDQQTTNKRKAARDLEEDLLGRKIDKDDDFPNYK